MRSLFDIPLLFLMAFIFIGPNAFGEASCPMIVGEIVGLYHDENQIKTSASDGSGKTYGELKEEYNNQMAQFVLLSGVKKLRNDYDQFLNESQGWKELFNSNISKGLTSIEAGLLAIQRLGAIVAVLDMLPDKLITALKTTKQNFNGDFHQYLLTTCASDTPTKVCTFLQPDTRGVWEDVRDWSGVLATDQRVVLNGFFNAVVNLKTDIAEKNIFPLVSHKIFFDKLLSLATGPFQSVDAEINILAQQQEAISDSLTALVEKIGLLPTQGNTPDLSDVSLFQKGLKQFESEVLQCLIPNTTCDEKKNLAMMQKIQKIVNGPAKLLSEQATAIRSLPISGLGDVSFDVIPVSDTTRLEDLYRIREGDHFSKGLTDLLAKLQPFAQDLKNFPVGTNCLNKTLSNENDLYHFLLDCGQKITDQAITNLQEAVAKSGEKLKIFRAKNKEQYEKFARALTALQAKFSTDCSAEEQAMISNCRPFISQLPAAQELAERGFEIVGRAITDDFAAEKDNKGYWTKLSQDCTNDENFSAKYPVSCAQGEREIARLERREVFNFIKKAHGDEYLHYDPATGLSSWQPRKTSRWAQHIGQYGLQQLTPLMAYQNMPSQIYNLEVAAMGQKQSQWQWQQWQDQYTQNSGCYTVFSYGCPIYQPGASGQFSWI